MAVGLAHFLTSWLSTTMMIANIYSFFWPAVGIASGVLIALGPRARWPVAAGVLASHIVVNSARSNSVINAVAFVLGNTAEPLIVAGLIRYYIGADFRLDRLRHLLGLVAAAVAASGAVAVGWAAALNYTMGLPLLTTWRDLVVTDSIGVILVAPLIIGLFEAVRQPPPASEIVKGAAAITLLVATFLFVIMLPRQVWEQLMPIAWLFPVLLWLAARCRPMFSAVGAFVVSMTIISTTILGVGHFGDSTRPIMDRSLEAVSAMLVVTLSALILGALFAERRGSEARLVQSYTLLKRERDNKLLNVKAATSSIAHEVRQPLTAIATTAYAARKILGRNPPDLGMVAESFDDIEQACVRANDVLANVRSLFEDAHGEQQPIDVNDLVREVLHLLREELSNYGVATHVEPAAELPRVMGHKVQLQEVILNLARNAIDAMSLVDGGRRALKIRTRRDGIGAVIIEVEDSGPGIDPGRLSGIFEPFVTTKPDGMGLGLAICSRIIEQHGGQLTASSDGKNGALFQIVLPDSLAATGASRRAAE